MTIDQKTVVIMTVDCISKQMYKMTVELNENIK